MSLPSRKCFINLNIPTHVDVTQEQTQRPRSAQWMKQTDWKRTSEERNKRQSEVPCIPLNKKKKKRAYSHYEGKEKARRPFPSRTSQTRPIHLRYPKGRVHGPDLPCCQRSNPPKKKRTPSQKQKKTTAGNALHDQASLCLPAPACRVIKRWNDAFSTFAHPIL